jgi:Zn-dependent protease with chaperone function
MSEEIDKIRALLSNALLNYHPRYTAKAMEFLKKMNANGYIIVSGFGQKDLPYCGPACSIGIGGLGIVFVEKSILESDVVHEKLKEFIIAHEVVHIARSHIVVYVFTRILCKVGLEAIKENLEEALESKKIEDFLLNLFILVLSMSFTARLVEIDAEVVKGQELEADNIAVKLAGCEGALLFANWLRELQRMGYNVSHEAVLGFPALTIEERVSNLLQQCRC